MFRKQIELIKDNQKNLENKSVLIVGAGGLGNVVATELSCIGLKNIYIMDFDEIEIHNIHRQFQFNKMDVGSKKAKILAKKIDRCSRSNIRSFCEKFEDFNKKIDLIIDCTDNFEVRKKIDKFAKSKNIPWLYSSVEAWIGQVCLFKEKNLDIFNISSNHKVAGVLPAMVGIVGSIEAMLATKYLAGLKVEFDKLIYIDFSENLKINTFKL